MRDGVVILLMAILVGSGNMLCAQSPGGSDDAAYQVKGKVVARGSEEPLEYATIRLLELPDSSLVGGIATGISGKFSVGVDQPGQYVLKASFVGYQDRSVSLKLNKGEREKEMGMIGLKPATSDIEQVTVTGNEYSVDYQVDKKVVHVDEQYSSISGTAVDVLKNVPSIKVDIQGEVTLRGSSHFTVLIDDRPTVLGANEALQQIPATSIKDIEIITNPSAKYDPEGTAGIINIVTKKNALMGLNGVVHANVGLDDKYGGDFLINYKSDHFRVFVGGDYGRRHYPGSVSRENETYQGDTTYYLHSSGANKDGDRDYNARAGFEWFPDERSTLTISGRYGGGVNNENSVTTYREWNSEEQDKQIYDSETDGERGHEFFALNNEYTYKFDSTEHKLDLRLMLYSSQGEEKTTNTLYNEGDNIRNSQKSEEGGPSRGLEYRVNYKQPFSQSVKIEAGVQGRLRRSEEWNDMYTYNITREEYDLRDKFSHESLYKRSIHAGYALVKGELGSLGYQAGIRGEYTFRDIKVEAADRATRINRWDYFPTFHFSYQLPKKNQLMASYTRRIERPHSWFMEPFLTWEDAYNVRQGNPALEPEYIDSWELGYQNTFNNQSLSLQVYYRITHNRIEWIRKVYEQNIMMETFKNVGSDYSLGTEVMYNMNINDWWENSLTGNFYDYRVKGELNGREFDRSSFTWSLRWSQTFHIGDNTRIQLNPSYEGPEVEAQEKEEGYFEVDGAIRHSFMDDKVNVTLQMRDIFSTAEHVSVIDQENFYNYSRFTHKSPIVMLNLTWRINDYEGNGQGRRRGGGAGGEF